MMNSRKPYAHDPRALHGHLIETLKYPEYQPPADDGGSPAMLEALERYAEALLWLVNDHTNELHRWLKENAHCSLGTTRFDAGLIAAGRESLISDIKAATEAAYENADACRVEREVA